MKRGQITAFIILGLIIVVAFGLFFFVDFAPPTDTSFETAALKQYVESCISHTAVEGILSNGLQGGYFILPSRSTSNLFVDVPYYYDIGETVPPDKDVFANHVALYVDTMLDLCLDYFGAFSGLNITSGTPASSATSSDQALTITTVFPLTIRQGQQTKELTSFKTTVAVPQLIQDLTLAQQIVASQQQEAVCVTCFSSLAAENDVFVGILPVGNSTYLIDLADRDYIINNEEYHLRFALRYDDTLE